MSSRYLLDEAIRGLTFIKEADTLRALYDVLPAVLTNLGGLIPHLGLKRNFEAMTTEEVTEDNYRDDGRRRYRSGGRNYTRTRGRGRGRVRFR